ncbi:nickel/cobalt transporter [Vibrio gallicus]|uniref:nickel/cobalt transporter n=1 Tax=Vibrio gallicus TaxID=190897 RepID=UPI0021C26158|nr:nickel/cobalt transporter [Vibrio gallicus]
MKINKITPLEVVEQPKSLAKPMLCIGISLSLVVAVLWYLWPTILINSIHFQKESLDYLTEQFYNGDSHATLIILGVCFLYGILHALGPGHGKVVVSTYLATNNTQFKSGIFITICSALVQAVVAVTLVSAFVFIFHQTMRELNATVSDFAVYSGVVVVVLGAQLIYSAVKRLYVSAKSTHTHGPDCGCGHKHSADATELNNISKPKEYIMIILSIGLRPCSGAILVLFFAHLTNLYWVGVIGTFLMSIGTAITTSTIAFLTVSGRKIIQYYTKASTTGMSAVMPALARSLAGLLLITIGVLLIVVPSYGVSPIFS